MVLRHVRGSGFADPQEARLMATGQRNRLRLDMVRIRQQTNDGHVYSAMARPHRGSGRAEVSDENEYVPYGRLLEFLANVLFVGTIFAVLYALQ